MPDWGPFNASPLGGGNSSTATYAEVMARISAACGSTSTVYMTQMHCAHPIHLAGLASASRNVGSPAL